ncbi:MATE family efflux transporter [Sorangium sp. KYC3313]|uniref:MATE efflux family protein n=1 Tax=Sorangium cellulosum (strain So ce56) TaxID=448385 RepID=A9GJ44_SORC5|nr:MATE family efflux transporter [Sorangium cellulosum]CAN93353.1 MATE efflux family protein [Sorangium cellulosum So ce56]
MKDLTQGSIARHIVTMAVPIAVGMIFQTLYYMIDLYFVGELGDVPLAGVSAAGNATFLVLALTQVLGVGTVAMISQAVGRKDRDEANVVFNQSLTLAAVSGLAVLVLGYLTTTPYMRSVAADAATVEAGRTYLFWFMPGLALQFALVAMGSALRGTGLVQPTLVVQLLTIVLNAILAPILIAGWGTHRPMGVAGAGLASTLSLVVAVIALWAYFRRLERYVGVSAPLLRPRLPIWRQLLAIGLPSGGEFALIFVYSAIVYWTLREFGSAAQAGYGAGSRLIQGLILPAMAVSFAAGPIAGQNFGAKLADRVRSTFSISAAIISALMVLLTLFVGWRAEALIGSFAKNADSIAVGAQFLRFACWNFVAQGLIFTCSSIFQGLGNTTPSLLSSGARLVTFAVPAIWLSTLPGFRIELVWYLSIASTTLQAIASVLLLRAEFKQRFVPGFVASGAGLGANS